MIGFTVSRMPGRQAVRAPRRAEAEHMQLVKAIETARAVDAPGAQAERPAPGL